MLEPCFDIARLDKLPDSAEALFPCKAANVDIAPQFLRRIGEMLLFVCIGGVDEALAFERMSKLKKACRVGEQLFAVTLHQG